MNSVVKMVNKVSPIKLTQTQIIIVLLVVLAVMNKDQVMKIVDDLRNKVMALVPKKEEKKEDKKEAKKDKKE